MSIWVICEASEGKFRSTAIELLSKARALGAGEVAGVVFGETPGADQLNRLADRVVTLKGQGTDGYDPDSWVGGLEKILGSESPKLVLFGEGIRTREIMPRLAARLGASVYANGVDLALEGSRFLFTSPAVGGKAYETIRLPETLCLAAFRPNSFDKGAPEVPGTSFETIEVPAATARIRVVERAAKSGGRIDLTEARAVVAVGRGLKAPENLKIAEELADALGGALGVSRAIVDAGWADHSIQVGKSGKTVSPALYIAAGISGAVHHTMGMDSSKVVVAVNTDPKAPIFSYADYGIVGDALEVLPALAAEIRKGAG